MLPKTAAGRMEAVMELLRGIPIYCQCGKDHGHQCDEIIGYTPPLITEADAREMLGMIDLPDDNPTNS